MSLFIATLAFGEGPLLAMSKIGTLAGSLGAGLCGSIFLLRRTKTDPAFPEPAESST
jgi:Na+/H+ antiporter NhaA